MPGSSSKTKRNHPYDQSRRASQHRGTRQGQVGQQKTAARPKNISSTTAALGPAGATFTLQRVEFGQCIDHELMEVGNQRDVKLYFAQSAAAVMEKYGLDTPMPEIASKISEPLEELYADPTSAHMPIEQLLDLQYVTLGQLAYCRDPVVLYRDPPANSPDYAGAATWEQYSATLRGTDDKMKTTHYVQAPQSEVRPSHTLAGSESAHSRTCCCHASPSFTVALS